MRRFALVVLVGLALVACSKKQSTTIDSVTTGPKDRGGGSAHRAKAQPGTDEVAATARDDDGNTTFAAVRFEFDSAQLDAEARAELERLATWMSSHVGAKVSLEGHTDERGTDEYNLALGERRSRAMRDYLVRLGVPSGRIQTISYGEERPSSSGSDDEAWAQNRRGEIVPRD